MITAIIKSSEYLLNIERMEKVIYTLQYENIPDKKRKDLLNDLNSINLDSDFWLTAAFISKGRDLRELCETKALEMAKKENKPLFPIMLAIGI